VGRSKTLKAVARESSRRALSASAAGGVCNAALADDTS